MSFGEVAMYIGLGGVILALLMLTLAGPDAEQEDQRPLVECRCSCDGETAVLEIVENE